MNSIEDLSLNLPHSAVKTYWSEKLKCVRREIEILEGQILAEGDGWENANLRLSRILNGLLKKHGFPVKALMHRDDEY